MTKAYAWQELRRLVVIDRTLVHLTKESRLIVEKQQETIAACSAAEQELTNAKQGHAECMKKIGLLTSDVTALREKAKKKARTLESITNPREYGALEKEIIDTNTRVEKLENELLELWEERDSRALVVKTLTTTCEKLEHEQETILAQLAIEHRQVESERHSAQMRWDAEAASAPAELVDLYRQMKARVIDPVVPAVGDSCSACFTQLLNSAGSKLSPKTIVQCPGCYRFICHPTALLDGEAAQSE